MGKYQTKNEHLFTSKIKQLHILEHKSASPTDMCSFQPVLTATTFQNTLHKVQALHSHLVI